MNNGRGRAPIEIRLIVRPMALRVLLTGKQMNNEHARDPLITYPFGYALIIPFRLNNSAYDILKYIAHLHRRRRSSERIANAIEIPQMRSSD